MNRVLVAGATGYLGRFVAREFKRRGAWVRVLARHPDKLRAPGPFLEPAVTGLVDDVFVGEVTRPETGSNWSSGLTLWDWLHGTLRLNVPQDSITIGVPAYRVAEEVTLPHVLVMPFGEQQDSWRLPGDGRPSRRPLPLPSEQLRE